MRKRLLGMMLSVSLGVTLLAGCSSGEGQEAAPETESSSGEESSAYSVGINCFGSSSYALLLLANNSEHVLEAYGDEVTVSDDNYQVDKIIQDVENMIAKGAKGLVVWLPADSLYPTVADICEENEVPFVLADKVPTDEAIAEELKENPYFAGAIGPANAVYGEQMAEFALEQGWTTCMTSSGTVGDPTDQPRIDAFREVFEAGGGTIVEELHADSSDAAQGQIDDALIANPDIDFIYGIGSEFGTAACAALESRGDTRIKVVTSGLDSEALDLLEEEKIAMLSGDNWISGIMAAVVLQNHIEGNPLKDADGNVPYITDILPFTLESNQIDLFRTCFIDHFCYSDDELDDMRTSINAEFDYNALVEKIDSYSFEERVQAQYEAGVATEEELMAAGISIQ